MKTRGGLERLLPLIEAEFLSRQAQLARLREQEAELRERLRDLSGRRTTPVEGAAIDPATLAGADIRWEAWAEQYRKDINFRIARLRVDQDKVKQELHRSFGRRSVAEAICKGNHTKGRVR